MAVTDIIVEELTADRAVDWDAYVHATPDATFFHLSTWKKAVEQAFGHPCPYLYAQQDGKVVGVLPLTRIKSLLFGHSMTSTAFGVYGGPVGDNDEVVAALTSAAVAVGENHGVGHIEFKAQEFQAPPGWISRADAYATFRKEIVDDPEKNLLGIPRKQRAVVRKSLANDLRTEVDDEIDRFFHLYATSVRNLGTPVFPKNWFQVLKDVFEDQCDVRTIMQGDRAVSSVLSFYFRDEVLPYYAGGTKESRRLGSNDFMYYDLMCSAAAKGYSIFDFGRSKTDSGAFSFKKNFGFEPRRLNYAYFVPNGGTVPDLSPNNPKYKAMISVWTRLPLPIANLIGPYISRSLG